MDSKSVFPIRISEIARGARVKDVSFSIRNDDGSDILKGHLIMLEEVANPSREHVVMTRTMAEDMVIRLIDELKLDDEVIQQRLDVLRRQKIPTSQDIDTRSMSADERIIHVQTVGSEYADRVFEVKDIPGEDEFFNAYWQEYLSRLLPTYKEHATKAFEKRLGVLNKNAAEAAEKLI